MPKAQLSVSGFAGLMDFLDSLGRALWGSSKSEQSERSISNASQEASGHKVSESEWS